MASGHGLTWDQQLLAAKVETTAGTAVALADADGAFNAFDTSVLPDFGFNQRPGQGSSLDQLKGVPGGRAANIKTTIELSNDGEGSNVPLWMSTFLAASGFSLSSDDATISSGSSSATTITVGHYLDGLKMFAAGCMFDMEATFEAGQTVPIVFTGRGVWQSLPTDTALLTPTYPTALPPVFQGATMTIAAASYVIPRAVLRLGNEVQLRPDGNSTAAYKAAFIARRRITWEIDLEASLLASKDWHTDHIAGTSAALSLAIGSGSNGVVTVTSPVIQQYAAPEPVNVNGLAYWRLRFQACRSAAAGDDSLVFTLT